MILFPYRLMPGFVARVLNLFDTAGVSPNVVQQTIHQETVLGLVAAGLGLSILPESVQRFQMPDLVTRPITGHPQTSLFAARRGSPSPAVDEFLRCLRAAERAEAV